MTKNKPKSPKKFKHVGWVAANGDKIMWSTADRQNNYVKVGISLFYKKQGWKVAKLFVDM